MDCATHLPNHLRERSFANQPLHLFQIALKDHKVNVRVPGDKTPIPKNSQECPVCGHEELRTAMLEVQTLAIVSSSELRKLEFFSASPAVTSFGGNKIFSTGTRNASTS